MANTWVIVGVLVAIVVVVLWAWRMYRSKKKEENVTQATGTVTTDHNFLNRSMAHPFTPVRRMSTKTAATSIDASTSNIDASTSSFHNEPEITTMRNELLNQVESDAASPMTALEIGIIVDDFKAGQGQEFSQFDAACFDGIFIDDEGVLLITSREDFEAFTKQCTENGTSPGVVFGGSQFPSDGDRSKMSVTDRWNQLISDVGTMKKCVDGCRTFFESNRVEFVQLAFEFPSATNRDAFTWFLGFFAQQFPTMRIVVRVPGFDPMVESGMNLPALNVMENVHFLLMTSDYPLNDDNMTVHNQSIRLARNAVEHLARQPGFRPEKCSVVIGAYGKIFAVDPHNYMNALKSREFHNIEMTNNPIPPEILSISHGKHHVNINKLMKVPEKQLVHYVEDDGGWIASKVGPILVSIPTEQGMRALVDIIREFNINSVVIKSTKHDPSNHVANILKSFSNRAMDHDGVTASEGDVIDETTTTKRQDCIFDPLKEKEIPPWAGVKLMRKPNSLVGAASRKRAQT